MKKLFFLGILSFFCSVDYLSAAEEVKPKKKVTFAANLQNVVVFESYLHDEQERFAHWMAIKDAKKKNLADRAEEEGSVSFIELSGKMCSPVSREEDSSLGQVLRLLADMERYDLPGTHRARQLKEFEKHYDDVSVEDRDWVDDKVLEIEVYGRRMLLIDMPDLGAIETYLTSVQTNLLDHYDKYPANIKLRNECKRLALALACVKRESLRRAKQDADRRKMRVEAIRDIVRREAVEGLVAKLEAKAEQKVD